MVELERLIMKKAIVIGATSGIGCELADILAENGYAVGVVGRRANILSELESNNQGNYFTKQRNKVRLRYSV